MSELTCLKLAVLGWVVHILAQSAFAGGSVGLEYSTGTRDGGVQPRGVLYPRATRALANYVENLVPFLGADLGLIVTGHTGGWGATIWVICRILYLPLYVAGVTPWRTVAWIVSVIGLLMMIWRLI